MTMATTPTPATPDMGTLPSDFLTSPAPSITKTTLDWSQTPLPENAPLTAIVLDNVLTPTECTALTAAALAQNDHKWEPALVRGAGAGINAQRLFTDLRNNERIMWDNRAVVARLWARIAPHVPELVDLRNNPHVMGNGPVRRGEVWRFEEVNERMRFLRYGPGEYFRPHCDGAFEREDGSARTFYTLHLYLNEKGEGNELVGGATSFHARDKKPERDVDVVPKVGRVLIFQHRNLLHSGQELVSGLKLTVRTDLLFKKTKKVVPEGERIKGVEEKFLRRKFAGRGVQSDRESSSRGGRGGKESAGRGRAGRKGVTDVGNS